MTSTPGNKLLPAPSVDGLCQMALGCEDNITVVGRSNSFNYQCSVSTHRVEDCRLGAGAYSFAETGGPPEVVSGSKDKCSRSAVMGTILSWYIPGLLR